MSDIPIGVRITDLKTKYYNNKIKKAMQKKKRVEK
jgi:hypothetical protein